MTTPDTHIPDEASLNRLIQSIPFVAHLGVSCVAHGDQITTILPFQSLLIGNPTLPAFHGGATGAFLEIAAGLQLCRSARVNQLPRTIDLTIDYMKPAGAQSLHARAEISKLGRTVSNVRVEAWQTSRDKPVAAAQVHFQMP